ncbi:chromatin modification- protein VID21 [Ascosphaera atra]|nr:chromatin modification- protein VID21 [Ascosphaera atra]
MQQQQQQYAQHAAAAAGVYQQHGPAGAHPQPGAGPLPTGHVPPPPPQAFGPTSVPTAAAAQHLAANGMPMRHPSNGMSGPSAAAAAAAAAGMPGVNGGMHVPGMPPGHIAPTPAAPHHGANPQAPPPHLAMHPAAANGNAAAAVMAVRQQGGHLPPGAAAALHAAMGNGGAGGSAPQLPGAMMMKMTPTAAAMDHAPLGMGNVPAPAASGRASISSQNSGVDNARILREASRLQEQQRLVQSRQQQQQQQHGGPHHAGHHQLAGQQPLLSQARGSPGLAAPATAGPGPRVSPMMGAAFPQAAATGAGSPPFTHNSHVTSAPTAASPRQNAGSPMAMASVPMTSAPSQGGHPHPHPQQQQQQPNHQQHPQPQQHPLTQPLPSLMAIQASIQRANPKLTPEQAGKYAAEKLHQFQQQRMSQMAMSAAAGTVTLFVAQVMTRGMVKSKFI